MKQFFRRKIREGIRKKVGLDWKGRWKRGNNGEKEKGIKKEVGINRKRNSEKRGNQFNTG